MALCTYFSTLGQIRGVQCKAEGELERKHKGGAAVQLAPPTNQGSGCVTGLPTRGSGQGAAAPPQSERAGAQGALPARAPSTRGRQPPGNCLGSRGGGPPPRSWLAVRLTAGWRCLGGGGGGRRGASLSQDGHSLVQGGEGEVVVKQPSGLQHLQTVEPKCEKRVSAKGRAAGCKG